MARYTDTRNSDGNGITMCITFLWCGVNVMMRIQDKGVETDVEMSLTL